MKKIKLTKGQQALVDDNDFEYLNQYHWHAAPNRTKTGFYAVRNSVSQSGTRLKIRMHREIMTVYDPKLEVDHVDGQGLNNQKHNLRVCSHSNNIKNQRKRKGSSKYRGVKRHGDKYWRADIMCNYKRYFLGLFTTQEQAARAYRLAAKRLYGEFASSTQKGEH